LFLLRCFCGGGIIVYYVVGGWVVYKGVTGLGKIIGWGGQHTVGKGGEGIDWMEAIMGWMGISTDKNGMDMT
jgi:hypothetical protein